MKSKECPRCRIRPAQYDHTCPCAFDLSCTCCPDCISGCAALAPVIASVIWERSRGGFRNCFSVIRDELQGVNELIVYPLPGEGHVPPNWPGGAPDGNH
jgi:hypothetical protein